MIRAVLYLLISIFAITFVRMVVGIITKGFADLMREEGKGAPSRTQAASSVPTSGELKPCRNCGTYVVASAAIKDTGKGEPVYFCSEDCRRKNATS